MTLKPTDCLQRNFYFETEGVCGFGPPRPVRALTHHTALQLSSPRLDVANLQVLDYHGSPHLANLRAHNSSIISLKRVPNKM
jgi:hypothetical protein